jgi:AraC family transcriptional regulator
MSSAGLEPATAFAHLDESTRLPAHRELDRFSVLRAEVSGSLPEAVRKSCDVPSLLVSISLRPVSPRNYRLWVDERDVPIGEIPALRTNVIDLAAGPTIWAGRGYDYLHFYLRRSVIDGLAEDSGYQPVGEFRATVGAEDLVLAQIAKTIAPLVDGRIGSAPLALDQLELILAAHVTQRYGAPHRRTTPFIGGLAAWQRRRATELLLASLDGKPRLAELARECGVSVSHFARCFKVSFGVTCHRWLTDHRIERAKELLGPSKASLAEVASQSGFGDQAAFTRTFHRVVGVTPGRWRREHRNGGGTR